MMRLSESVRRNIIEMSAGAILNKFKLIKRRNIIFFDDVFYDYISSLEKDSSGRLVTYALGREWMLLYFRVLVPPGFRRIPPALFINGIMKHIWHTLGLLKDIRAEVNSKNTMILKTWGEKITDRLGRNSFLPGLYTGVLEGLYGKHVECVGVKQSKKLCEYVFEVTKRDVVVNAKTPHEYLKLNKVSADFSRRVTLKLALEKKVFNMKEDNRIYFRGKPVSIVENTIFHLIGLKDFKLQVVSERSREFFGEVLEQCSREACLSFLRSLVELMGWGKTALEGEKNSIQIHILNPPYGLQKNGDNWKFLARWMEGYLKNMENGEDFVFKEIKERGRSITISYVRS